jgi:hypothetical protein
VASVRCWRMRAGDNYFILTHFHPNKKISWKNKQINTKTTYSTVCRVTLESSLPRMKKQESAQTKE